MASNGRYQSHLLSFLSRQRQKIADQTSVLLRHTKLATLWGAQILLYPVYALYQTTRLAGRQLQQTAQRAFLSLRFGTEAADAAQADRFEIDASIERVLAAVHHVVHPELPEFRERESSPIATSQWNLGLLLRPVALVRRFFSPASVEIQEIQTDSAPGTMTPATAASLTSQPSEGTTTPARLPIQAVASLIDTRNLVLVLEGNVIFDRLTPDQQRKIEQRIIFELATYWHWLRQRSFSSRSSTPLSLPNDRPTLLAPVRVFRQLMAWVQTGPIAIATNVFQESALITHSDSEGSGIHDLDWFVPNLGESTFNLRGFVPRKLPSSGDLKTTLGQLPKWTDLEALVWAAVHYFFGGRERRFAATYPYLPDAPDTTHHRSVDRLVPSTPWLSWSDVFDRPPVKTTQLKTTQANTTAIIQTEEFLQANFPNIAALPLSPQPGRDIALPARPKFSFGQSLRRWMQGYFRSQTSAVVPRSSDTSSPPSETSDTAVVEHDRSEAYLVISEVDGLSTNGISEEHTPQATELHIPYPISHAQDWIDAEVSEAGYIKSPVEKMMGWLDAFVSWIEAKLIAVWNWLTARES
jgi:hypothetical protein